MDVVIIETGERGYLSIVDPKTGLDWINDLMGNHNELPEYDMDEGVYRMRRHDYIWWRDLVRAYQAADNRYHELLADLDEDRREALEMEVQEIACDLEDYPAQLNMVCDRFAD